MERSVSCAHFSGRVIYQIPILQPEELASDNEKHVSPGCSIIFQMIPDSMKVYYPNVFLETLFIAVFLKHTWRSIGVITPGTQKKITKS